VPTIAIDFDGVIHKYSEGWKDGSIYDEPVEDAFGTIYYLIDSGIAVYVHTSRKPWPIANWLNENHFKLPLILETMKARREFWNRTNALLITNRKLPASAYIDDRGIRFSDWIQTIDALRSLKIVK
jgi:hypothetical protein